MISILRASTRLALFFFLSLVAVLLVALGNFFLKLFSGAWAIRWKNAVAKNWARSISFIIGMELNVKETPPKPPFFLVSNHLSYIDIVPFWFCLSATFIAKREIKSWPFFGLGSKILGVLFIDRDQKRDVQRMNNRISDTISENQGIILFPEGTSTNGEKVLSFNSSLLEYPAKNEIAVSYASISYRSYDKSRPAYLNICWWGDMKFLSHFWELLKIPAFEATLTFGDDKISHSDRKVLARKLQQAISRSFRPVVSKRQRAKLKTNIDKKNKWDSGCGE